MKKILIAVMACVMLAGCGNGEGRETSNEVIADSTVVCTEEVTEETVDAEEEETLASPEYLAELEYNSQTNQW